MNWLRLFGRHGKKSVTEMAGLASLAQTVPDDASNWLPSMHNEIVRLSHNPGRLQVEGGIRTKVRSLLESAKTRPIGTRDLWEEPLVEDLPVLQIPIIDHCQSNGTVVSFHA